ncbi:MAG TPA: hypothetical protein VK639_01745 [Terriglobales bacterium]|nr:hypothetical protein [Terriglobales bacterium]
MSSSISKIYKPGIILVFLYVFSLQVTAQSFSSAPSLRQLTRSSGYIFAGKVSAIERVAARATPDVATVKITFQVEQGIRGVHRGQTLVIREWGGLWEQGERYRTGERVLLFLYRPSKLGLTSPVAGVLGRFAVDKAGQINLQDRIASLDSDPVAVRLRRKSRVTSGDFARAIRRMVEE